MKLMCSLVGASLIMGACATESQTGTAVGAGAGGLIGAAAGGWQGALFGAAVGGLLGYGVGRSVEVENERRMEYALEADRQSRWTNPDTGYVYTVEPQPIYYDRGRSCRQFSMVAEIDGRPRNVYGTACRTAEGRWDVVSTD
jgi:surface antigen